MCVVDLNVWVPLCLLVISEILPFLEHEPNGVLHFLVLFIKAFQYVQQQEHQQHEATTTTTTTIELVHPTPTPSVKDT